MQKMLLVAAGAAAGYVLGMRRGRQGYDKLKRQAQDLVNNPRVQQGVSDAQQFINDKVPVVGEKVASVIGTARDAATEAARQPSSPGSDRRSSAGGSSTGSWTPASTGGSSGSSTGGSSTAQPGTT